MGGWGGRKEDVVETITEFPAEQSASAWDGPLGWILAILVLGVVFTAIGFMLGRHQVRRALDDNRRQAAEVIYDAIHAKLRLAVGATGGAVETQAQELLQEIERRLGRVSLVTNGFGKPVKAIDEVLHPKPKPQEQISATKSEDALALVMPLVNHSLTVQEQTKDVVSQHPLSLVAGGQAGGNLMFNGVGHGTGVHPGGKPGPQPGRGGTTVTDSLSVSAPVVLKIEPHKDKPEDKAKVPPVTPASYQAAIRMSLDQLAQHWGAREALIAEIEAAQAQLVYPDPLPTLRVVSGPRV